MSMPTFPEFDPDITCEHALNMILTSIAAEELALSHIMNAEGEKLQFAIKSLGSSCGSKYDIHEILKVNQSITCLLDSVAQNQIILKGKMDKALHALSVICPAKSCPPQPCCHDKCCCTASFRVHDKCHLWCPGSALPWRVEKAGKCVCCDKSRIEFCNKGRFLVSFTANINAHDRGCSVAISLHLIKNHQHRDLFILRDDIHCGSDGVTVSIGQCLIEGPCQLLVRLESREPLVVEDSLLTIVEIPD